MEKTTKNSGGIHESFHFVHLSSAAGTVRDPAFSSVPKLLV